MVKAVAINERRPLIISARSNSEFIDKVLVAVEEGLIPVETMLFVFNITKEQLKKALTPKNK